MVMVEPELGRARRIPGRRISQGDLLVEEAEPPRGEVREGAAGGRCRGVDGEEGARHPGRRACRRGPSLLEAVRPPAQGLLLGAEPHPVGQLGRAQVDDRPSVQTGPFEGPGHGWSFASAEMPSAKDRGA